MDYHALTFSCKQQRIVMIGSLTTVMLLKATQVPKYTLKNAVFQMVIICYHARTPEIVSGSITEFVSQSFNTNLMAMVGLSETVQISTLISCRMDR